MDLECTKSEWTFLLACLLENYNVSCDYSDPTFRAHILEIESQIVQLDISGKFTD